MGYRLRDPSPVPTPLVCNAAMCPGSEFDHGGGGVRAEHTHTRTQRKRNKLKFPVEMVVVMEEFYEN